MIDRTPTSSVADSADRATDRAADGDEVGSPGPVGSPNSDSDYLAALLDCSPGIVFVIDADLVVSWVNRAATDLLGYPAEEVVGVSVLEFLDPSWNPAAFESIATAFSSASGVRPPMTFRTRARDGTTPIIEATANIQLDHPLINGVVVYARRWTERWLLDQTLDSIAAGASIARSLELLVQVAGSDTMEADAAIIFDRIAGRVAGAITASNLSPELSGPRHDAASDVVHAWSSLLDGSTGRVYDIAELAEPIRSIAIGQGYQSLWLWPAQQASGASPDVWAVAWRRHRHLDADETRVAMMCRLADLAALVIERSRSEAANAYAATHDDLTGLDNRASLLVRLSNMLEPDPDAAGGRLSPVGVIYLDLDGFKAINDEFGHSAGDRVLADVAQSLAEVAPADGVIARLGGDEFAFSGPVADRAELEELANDLLTALTGDIHLRTGELVNVGASLGVAIGSPGTITAHDLLEDADQGLYTSKRAGGGIASALHEVRNRSR